MAVDTSTSAQAAADKAVFQPVGSGYVCKGWGTFDLVANVEVGDLYEMYRVPARAQVFAGVVYAEDLDTGGTEALELDCGWADNGSDGVDLDGFGDFGVWEGDAVTDILVVAGIWRPYANIIQSEGFKLFARETIIQLDAVGVAATFSAGQMSTYGLYTVE